MIIVILLNYKQREKSRMKPRRNLQIAVDLGFKNSFDSWRLWFTEISLPADWKNAVVYINCRINSLCWTAV